MDAAPTTLKLKLSDEDLAGLALGGCLESFEELVRRYQVPLMRFLLLRGTSRQDAEDLVQETFLRAYQSLKKYNNAWAFKTWIFTISYRLAVSQHRRGVVSPSLASTQEISDRQTGPLARLEYQESRRQLWDLARAVLSDAQFTVVWLYYAESLPAAEVGRVMNRSWVWVKTNLHRSRRKLRASLEPQSAEAVGMTREPT